MSDDTLASLLAPDAEGAIHAVMTFPSRAAMLAAAKFTTSWIIVADDDVRRALDSVMPNSVQARRWEHTVVYGLGSKDAEMEAEGWEVCAAFTTGDPEEPQPYVIWKRPRFK